MTAHYPRYGYGTDTPRPPPAADTCRHIERLERVTALFVATVDRNWCRSRSTNPTSGAKARRRRWSYSRRVAGPPMTWGVSSLAG
jgi:hypothetical protein